MLAAPPADRLAVEPIAREDTGAAESPLTDAVAAEVAQVPGFELVPQPEDGEVAELARTCSMATVEAVLSLRCLAQVASLRLARFLLVGVVQSTETESHLVLRLFDAQANDFVAEQQFQCSGTAHTDLVEVVKQLTRRLLSRTAPTGDAMVQLDGPAGKAIIDGDIKASVPGQLPLVEGPHQIRYAPFDRAEGLGTFDALAGASLTYTLFPPEPSTPPTHMRKPVAFPWGDLVVGIIGAGVGTATIIGAGYINGNAGSPNVGTIGSAAVDVGLFVGIGGIAYAIGRIADNY